MSEHSIYSEAISVANMEDCLFYHSIDLPGIGEILGNWDLRHTFEAYTGNFNFSGKRVLDVGAASGYITFEMEKRGAEVVSFDMDSGLQWNLVPHFRFDMEAQFNQAVQDHKQLKNSYWYCHEKLKSNAKVYYGNIYNLPEALGNFDVVFLGMILSHLRDPFQALYSASRLSTETLIITNPMRPSKQHDVLFMPNASDSSTLKGWWSFSENALVRMINVLGFEVVNTVKEAHKCLRKDWKPLVDCTALVARRIKSS